MGTYPTGVAYRGINRSGGEWLDEWDGWHMQEFYEIPDETRLSAELGLFKSAGFNAIRFPISWERLQHTLQGPLDPSTTAGGTGYTDQVTGFVQQATAAGWLVIVDLHNYNRYATDAFDAAGHLTPPGVFTKHVFGDGTLGVADLVDVWTRLASLFLGNSGVVFGLMNEPHDFPCDRDELVNPTDSDIAWCNRYKIPSDLWFACLQQVVYAIRSTGADQLILVPNSRGSDVSHWDTWAPQHGPLDSVAALAITDTSVNNLAFDMHAYHSPGAPTSYSNEVTTVTDWARGHGKKLWLSEMGVENQDTTDGPNQLTDLFTYLNANADVWLGWAAWDDADEDGQHYALTHLDTARNRSAGIQMPWYTPHLTPNTV